VNNISILNKKNTKNGKMIHEERTVGHKNNLLNQLLTMKIIAFFCCHVFRKRNEGIGIHEQNQCIIVIVDGKAIPADF
jgi:hypothetical protein